MFKLSKRSALKNYFVLTFTFFASKSNELLAAWPSKAFESNSSEQAINHVTAEKQAIESDAINIKVPDIAENGAVVPVTVSTDLSNVKNISILVENNPNPLTSLFEINEHAEPFVSTRVKMAATSDVIAIVTTKDDIYFTKRNIKVTIGGCGG